MQLPCSLHMEIVRNIWVFKAEFAMRWCIDCTTPVPSLSVESPYMKKSFCITLHFFGTAYAASSNLEIAVPVPCKCPIHESAISLQFFCFHFYQNLYVCYTMRAGPPCSTSGGLCGATFMCSGYSLRIFMLHHKSGESIMLYRPKFWVSVHPSVLPSSVSAP